MDILLKGHNSGIKTHSKKPMTKKPTKMLRELRDNNNNNTVNTATFLKNGKLSVLSIETWVHDSMTF